MASSVSIVGFVFPFIHQLMHTHIDNMGILRNAKATTEDIDLQNIKRTKEN